MFGLPEHKVQLMFLILPLRYREQDTNLKSQRGDGVGGDGGEPRCGKRFLWCAQQSVNPPRWARPMSLMRRAMSCVFSPLGEIEFL